MAEKQSLSYRSDVVATAAKSFESQPDEDPANLLDVTAAVRTSEEKCYFCGYKWHPRNKCPAREATCRKCCKAEHFAKVCKLGEKPHKTAMAITSSSSRNPSLATISAVSPIDSLLRRHRSV